MLQPKYYAIITVIGNNAITIESIHHSTIFDAVSSNLNYSGINVFESYTNIGSDVIV